MRFAVLALLFAALVPVGAARAQTASETLVKDYEKARLEELLEAGQRHVSLGWSIRDTGLIQQAQWQFVRAVELSEGKHQGATMVLGWVQTLGDTFWKKRKKKPARHSVRAYEKNARMLDEADRKGQIRLAKAATKAKLTERAREHWLAALELGASIEIAADVAKVGGEKVPVELAEWLQQQTRSVGQKLAFEPAGGKAPKLADVREVRDDKVVVRTDVEGAVVHELHALGLALWDRLADRLDAAPVRPLQLFVFRKRADYEAYLKACGHAGALGGSGLCDYGTYQTLVSAEGLAPVDLQALVMHELTHLFFFGSAPVTMPDWYEEGFAESFGGQGTFTWDGKRLEIGGLLRKDRLTDLQANVMPLAELFAADAERLLATDHARGMRFYAQCWALQRWFLLPDGAYRDRFLAWEDQCRSAMPGVATTRRFGDPAPAKAAFEKEFAKDLPKIEAAFRAWLGGL